MKIYTYPNSLKLLAALGSDSDFLNVGENLKVNRPSCQNKADEDDACFTFAALLSMGSDSDFLNIGEKINRHSCQNKTDEDDARFNFAATTFACAAAAKLRLRVMGPA
jgi:hypothetical protein